MATARTRRSVSTLFALAAVAAAGVALGPAARGAPLAAEASVSPQLQYLNDKAGTQLTFTVDNTGTNAIGAVEIIRPNAYWTVTACPGAPAGWTASRRNGVACRYVSAVTATDDLAPGQSSDAFTLKAGSAGGLTDRAANWIVMVSPSNRLDNPGILAGAIGSSAGALEVKVHSFQITDVVVAASAPKAGSPCPAGDHAAGTGSTQIVVVCGKNWSNLTQTPVAAQASLGGTFVASPGVFTAGPVAKTRSGSVVLGIWSGVTITSTPLSDMTVVAQVGSTPNQTSPFTERSGYTALNAPPVPGGPYSLTVDEDEAQAVTVSATDADGDGVAFTVATGPVHGTLGVFATPTCSGTPWTCTSSAQYTPDPDFNGTDSFEFSASDEFASVTGAVNVTVAAVNDPPVITAPSSATGDEGQDVVFSTAGGNPITVAHVDDGSILVTMSAGHGTLTLSGVGGLAFADGDGVADPTMEFSGTPEAINSALAGLRFTPAPGYSGSASVDITADDNGNTGTGDVTSDAVSVAITMGAVNDPPVNHLPSPASVDEDTALLLSGAGAISVSDPDAGSGDVAVTLTGFHGTVAVTGTPGVTVTGDGNPELALSGTIENLNTALGTLTFTPDADYAGSASITVSTNDQGNTGGAAQGDTDIVEVTVNPVNDAPVNSLPGAQTVGEDADLVLSAGNGNQISVSDVDAGTGPVEVTLTTAQGTLTPGGTAGLTVTGSGTGTLTLTGTIADVNSGLDGLRFTPSPGFSGPATITMTTDDQGNTGSGGTLSTTDTLAVTVGAVNDPPVNSLPSPPAATEDSALVMSGSGTISVSDPDAGSNPVQLTLTATGGSLTLSGTTGLTVTGNGTAAVVLTGPISNLNAALDGMTFTPAPDYAGPASISVLTDDQGNSGSGGPLSDADTLTFTVSAVNDAPVNAVPGAQTVAEDSELVFSTANGNRIMVSDVDAGTGPVEVTLTTAEGTLTPGSTSGLTVTGNGTGTLTAAGTIADVNTGLDGLRFTPAAGYSGSTTITVTTSDLGNSGSGGAATDTDMVAVTVGAVNDPPVNSLPSPPAAAEDTLLTMSGTGAISVSDPDAGTGSLQVTLTATNGILTLSGTTGLSVTGDGTATVVLTGPLGSVNAALDGMTFLAPANYSGSASIAVVTDDQGNSGSGGPRSDSDTLTFTVSAVNDPPVNTVPGAQSVDQDGHLFFSGTNGNQISVSDVDAGSGDVRVTLSATHATLFTERTTGLTSLSPSGQHAATLTFTGPISGLNTALNYLHFDPTPGYSGADSLVITTNDQGNSGSGGAQADTDTIAVTVVRLNQAPVISLPAAPSVDEDAILTLAGAGALQISDPDAGMAAVEVQLSSTNGTMTLDGTAGLSLTAGDGTADAAMTFKGPIGDINAALDGMTFTPTANFAGSASIGLTANDLGNTGGGGAQSDTDTLAVTVNAVNDPPVNTVPGPQVINEDSELVFSTDNGNAISVAHVDPGTVQVTLAVTDGVLTLRNVPAGLVFSVGDGMADATMTFTGSIADVNTALTGLRYWPSPEFSGSVSVSITTNDQGNTGTGGALQDADTVAITLNSVNDPPVNHLPAPPSRPEDTPLTLSGTGAVSVSDADAGTSPVQVALSVTNGTLTLDGTAGLVFTAGDGTADAAMTFTGAISDVNAALDGMSFTPTANFNGSATIAITTNDQGNTGPDGAKSDSDSLTVTVSAVNDAPVTTAPSSISIYEDSNAVFSGGWPAITVADVDAATVAVSLSAAHGTLTLSGRGGLTFTAGDGTADALMSFSGAVNDVNTAVNGLVFGPDLNFNDSRGSAGLTITTSDLGNTGSGGPQSDTDAVAISVAPVADAPVAADLSYASGAVQTNMKRLAVGNLLDGATDPDSGDGEYTAALTVAAVGSTTPSGGAVTFNSSTGVFDVDPPPGVTGNLTFTYTVSDNGNPGPGLPSAAGTVTVNVAGPVIWFVNPAVATNGNGRLSTPFKYLSTSGLNNDPGDVDATGHRVFVYTGTASGGIALHPDEWLIGQGATAAGFDTLFGISPPAGTIARPALGGTRPALQGSVTSSGLVTLANNTVVRGLNITPLSATPGLWASGATGAAVSEVSVTTTNATAVSLTNSDGTFAFTAVSASGGTNGIAWNNTALQATGSLTVAGTGTANSGGTIQNSTGDGISLLRADEVSLSRMLISHPAGDGINATSVTGLTLADGTIEYTGDDGIALSGTSSPSLSGMTINTTGGDGISGTGVTNLTFSGGSISDAGNGDDEDALAFDTVGAQNISGTLTVTNATIQRFEEKGLSVTNNAGTLAVTITSTNFSDNDDVNGNDAVNVATTGTAGATLNVSGGTFDNIETAAVGFDAAGSGTHDIDIVGITATNQGGPDNYPADAYIRLSAQDQHSLTFDIRGNTLQNTRGDGIVVMGDGNVNGRIGGPSTSDGNTITGDNPGIGDGVRIDMDGYFGQSVSSASFTWRLLIQHNTIAVGNASGGSDQGIQVLNRDHTGPLYLTIADNSISNTANEGIRYYGGDRSSLGSPRGEVAVRNNTFTNTAAAWYDLAFQTSDTSSACFDVTGNSRTSAGPLDIFFSRLDSSTIGITQSSLTALGTANSSATVAGSVSSYNQTCNPALPTIP